MSLLNSSCDTKSRAANARASTALSTVGSQGFDKNWCAGAPTRCTDCRSEPVVSPIRSVVGESSMISLSSLTPAPSGSSSSTPAAANSVARIRAAPRAAESVHSNSHFGRMSSKPARTADVSAASADTKRICLLEEAPDPNALGSAAAGVITDPMSVQDFLSRDSTPMEPQQRGHSGGSTPKGASLMPARPRTPASISGRVPSAGWGHDHFDAPSPYPLDKLSRRSAVRHHHVNVLQPAQGRNGSPSKFCMIETKDHLLRRPDHRPLN